MRCLKDASYFFESLYIWMVLECKTVSIAKYVNAVLICHENLKIYFIIRKKCITFNDVEST